jgi:hypothetical protein
VSQVPDLFRELHVSTSGAYDIVSREFSFAPRSAFGLVFPVRVGQCPDATRKRKPGIFWILSKKLPSRVGSNARLSGEIEGELGRNSENYGKFSIFLKYQQRKQSTSKTQGKGEWCADHKIVLIDFATRGDTSGTVPGRIFMNIKCPRERTSNQ